MKAFIDSTGEENVIIRVPSKLRDASVLILNLARTIYET